MPSPAIDESLWEIVVSARGAVLATVGPTGHPHLSNVHYLADPDAMTLLVTTTADRVKGRNLLRDPRVAVHVAGADWFQFAVVEGTATATIAQRVGDHATDGLHRIFTSFRGEQVRPDFDESMIAKGRMIVEINVDRLYGLLPTAPATGAA